MIIIRYRLNPVNVLGLWPPVALLYFKAYLVTLIESLETVTANGGIVNKKIRTIFLLNKAKSLSIIKPLHNTISQCVYILLNLYFL